MPGADGVDHRVWRVIIAGIERMNGKSRGMRSKVMTYTQAKRIAARYERAGYKVRLEEAGATYRAPA